MGRFFFGSQEDLNCLAGIKRFEIETNDGAVDVCYAALVSRDSIFLPWRVYVKDYVFYPEGDSYYTPTKNGIKSLQSDGTLPDPLPEYSLTNFDLVFGNFLWIFIGIVLAYTGIASLFEKKETTEAEDKVNDGG